MAITYTLDTQRRFWAKVIIGSFDDCWNWTGALNPKGYGSIWNGYKTVGAHRLSMCLADADPGDKFACHRCNNPSCVNPRHLYAGTRADNAHDMVVAGSMKGPRPWRQGEKNPVAKLTEAEVLTIRARHGSVSQEKMAAEHGVCVMTINKIVTGKTWRHVGVA